MHNTHTSIEEHLHYALTGFERTPGDVPEALAHFFISRAFPGFAGHFPGAPLFSAIFQLTLVRLAAGFLLGRPLVPLRTGKVKFNGMVLPDEEVAVAVTLRLGTDGWTVPFTITRREEKVASGSLTFREAR